MNLNFDLDRPAENFRHEALGDWPEGRTNPHTVPFRYFATRVDYLPLRETPHHAELYRYNVVDYDWRTRETWLTIGETNNHRKKVYDLGLWEERDISALCGHYWPRADTPYSTEQYWADEEKEAKLSNLPSGFERPRLHHDHDPYRVANVLITDQIRQSQFDQYREDQPQHDYNPIPKKVRMWCGYEVPINPLLSKGREKGFTFRDQQGMMVHTYLSEKEHVYYSGLGWGEDDYQSQNSFEAQFPMPEFPTNPHLQGNEAYLPTQQDYINDLEMKDYDTDDTIVDPEVAAAEERERAEERKEAQESTTANVSHYYQQRLSQNQGEPAGNPYAAAAGAPRMPEQAVWGPRANQPRAARPRSRLSITSFPDDLNTSPAVPVSQTRRRQPREKKYDYVVTGQPFEDFDPVVQPSRMRPRRQDPAAATGSRAGAAAAPPLAGPAPAAQAPAPAGQAPSRPAAPAAAPVRLPPHVIVPPTQATGARTSKRKRTMTQKQQEIEEEKDAKRRRGDSL